MEDEEPLLHPDNELYSSDGYSCLLTILVTIVNTTFAGLAWSSFHFEDNTTLNDVALLAISIVSGSMISILCSMCVPLWTPYNLHD